MLKAIIITNVFWCALIGAIFSGNASASPPVAVPASTETCWTEPDISEMDSRIARLERIVLALHARTPPAVRLELELNSLRNDYRRHGLVEVCEE